MSSRAYPGEWFDGLPYVVNDDYTDDYDEYDPDDETPTAPRMDWISGHVAELRTLAKDLADRGDWAAAHKLRTMARDLEFRGSEFLDASALLMAGPRSVAEPREDSATGNCRTCGTPLPLPTMRRGRPRVLCLGCSPSKRKR